MTWNVISGKAKAAKQRTVGTPAWAAVLLAVLVAMLALGPVTPASTAVASPLCLVGLIDAQEDPATDDADGEPDLLQQLLSQVQQIQEEEDLHTRELPELGQPAGAPITRARRHLVWTGEDMSPRLSRPPRPLVA